MRMLILILAVVFVCGCQNNNKIESKDADLPKTVPIQQSISETNESGEIILVVHGMGCPLCATNLRKKIMSLDGITAVYPDLDTGDVGVRYEAGKKPSYQQIEEIVKQSGFTLVKIKG